MNPLKNEPPFTQELIMQRDRLSGELEQLRALLCECRSSVKFDLTHYAKAGRSYGNGNLGAEADSEANRLHGLLDKIDATLKEPKL